MREVVAKAIWEENRKAQRWLPAWDELPVRDRYRREHTYRIADAVLKVLKEELS